MNSVTVTGRLVKQPEIEQTRTGLDFCNCTVAVTDGFGDREHTSYFDFTLWGSRARNLQPYLEKGKPVGVTGSLKQERWVNKEGKNKSKISIVVSNFEFLGFNKEQ